VILYSDIIKNNKNMGKLKQYEIDAIVSIIRNQIDEITEAKTEARFGEANAEMQKLGDEIDEMEKKVDALRKAKDRRGEEWVKKLGEDVHYNSWGNEFTTTEKGSWDSIRNEVIISQLDLTSDVDTFIKKIVDKYSK
jgi:hypothetical protein